MNKILMKLAGAALAITLLGASWNYLVEKFVNLVNPYHKLAPYDSFVN